MDACWQTAVARRCGHRLVLSIRCDGHPCAGGMSVVLILNWVMGEEDDEDAAADR